MEDVSLVAEKSARENPILNHINLQITKAEKVAIFGPSGAGKTSLLNVMAGFDKASSGRVTLLERDLTRANEDQLAALRKGRVGIILQEDSLISSFTVAQNVGLAMTHLSPDLAREHTVEMLEKVGMRAFAERYPDTLSGGEKQRVSVARALVSVPEIVFADEPTGSLDEANAKQVIDLLFALSEEEGATLVIVTHDRDIAERADRIIHVANGELVD